MLMGDRKKTVSIIVGSLQPSYVGKKDGAMEGEYVTPNDASDAQLECAEDLIAAVKAGDAEGLVKAFKDLTTLCGEGEEYPEHEEV